MPPWSRFNCTADVRADSCDVWASMQMQTLSAAAAAQASGLPPEKVHIHSHFMGGGFGRRGMVDFVSEAVEVSKAIGAPVKITWTREDDMHHDAYRTCEGLYSWKFAAGLDADGWLVGDGPTASSPRPFSTPLRGSPRKKGIDRTSTEGSHDMGYNIPNKLVDYHWDRSRHPVTYWRAVGYTQNTTSSWKASWTKMALAGGKDPVEFRRKLLAENPRLLGVLELAAKQAGWGTPLPAGRFRGVAVVNNVGSFTAQIAEISVDWRQGRRYTESSARSIAEMW